jgi:hypothetical protein
VWTRLPITSTKLCVLITAGPSTKLCGRCVCLLLQDLVQSCLRGGGGGIWEDMCYERSRGLRTSVCFITAGPITKLFAWGEEESGGHVL